jgi:glyoxylase-like metal-dependent hydrolase (beta-lactamase superfamily II)
MRALADGVTGFTERLHRVPQSERDEHQRIELSEGFFICSLRTLTLPPATHTNCYLVGGDEMVIVDPGSPFDEEQAKLDNLIDTLLAEGRKLREILVCIFIPTISVLNTGPNRYRSPVTG